MKIEVSPTIVRFERSALEPGHVDGRIIATSSKRFAVAVVSDVIRTDGVRVFRRSDVSTLGPAPYATFITDALRLRKDAFPRARRLELSSWQALVGWACVRYPLVTIHIEKRRTGVCYIGQPTRMTAKALTLATIGPDARWNAEPRVFAWADVTQVGFGGGYEEALALVDRARK